MHLLPSLCQGSKLNLRSPFYFFYRIFFYHSFKPLNSTFLFLLNVPRSLFDAEAFSADDELGSASISLAKARIHHEDKLQAPVIRPKSRKQKGYVSITLQFEPNDALLMPPTQQTPYAQQASFTLYQPPQFPQYPSAYQYPSGYFACPPSAPAYAYPHALAASSIDLAASLEMLLRKR